MKWVLITGSGKRLGKELAIRFAEKKYNIILHYNSSKKDALATLTRLKEIGIDTLLVQGNLEIKKDIDSIFYHLKQEGITPDILVNNAAIYPTSKSLANTELDLWDSTLNINLRSTFYMSKLFSIEGKNGSKIVNIASLGAFHIWKERIPYNVSKAGVIQLTKALARELTPKIAVNSVSPGTILIANDEPSEPIQLNEKHIPFGRYGKPDDVFEAVYFFSTCSNFITGQNICVDGGFGLI